MTEVTTSPSTGQANPGRIANTIISVVLAFAIADALYAIHAHRVVYLRFAAAFLIVLAASFRLRPDRRANFALILIGSILALYGAEVIILIASPMIMARNVWKARSEERRVGKEWREGGAGCQS